MAKMVMPDTWSMELVGDWDDPEIVPAGVLAPPRNGGFRFTLWYTGAKVFEMRTRPEWHEPQVWFQTINEDVHPLQLLMEDANREASMGTKAYCHLTDLETARDGKTLVDRYWVVKPGAGAVFHLATGGRLTVPQCNGNEQIATDIRDKLYPGCDVVFVPVAYLGQDGKCGGNLRDS